MAVKGRRAKHRQRKHLFLAIFFIALVVGAAAAFAYLKLQAQPTPNAATLCPAEGPRGHYVLLVDKTDPLNFTQKQSFNVFLEDLVKRRVPEGYLLSVFVLGEDFKSTAEPLMELCNPGTGDNKSALTSNVERARRTYEEKFIKPLLSQAEALQSTQPAKLSPILEMVQLVAITGFRKHDVQGERRLFLMSDMLHNAASLSMYRGTPSYLEFAGTDYGRKTKAALKDVHVELHYLLNAPQLQTRRNLLFWEHYFREAGVQQIQVQLLEG